VLQISDSSAVSQAKQVLNQVAQNKLSKNQAVAQDYLKQLKED
jgi:flagella basal body P-ring formation protein FlgA